MTKYAKTLCSLAITAATLVTFSLSSNEASAGYRVMRRVAVTHNTRPVNKARPSPFVRGKLNSYAASNLRKSGNQASLNRQNLTNGKGQGGVEVRDHRNGGNVEIRDHRNGSTSAGQGSSSGIKTINYPGKVGDKHPGHDGDKDGGKHRGPDGYKEGDKHSGHDGDKDKYGDKGLGRDGNKDKYGDKGLGRDGNRDKYGDKGNRGDGNVEVRDHRGDKDMNGGNVRDHRGDKDKNGGKERPMGGQQAGGQQASGQQGGSGFPDLSSLGSAGGSASPSSAGSSSPAADDTSASSNCTSHHTWRNGQRVLIQVCPDA